MKYNIFIGLFAVGLLIFILTSCNNSDNNKTLEKELELQNRELDLKQKELELKEKELKEKELELKEKELKEKELQTNNQVISNNTNVDAKKNEPKQIVSDINKPLFKWTPFNLPTTVGNLVSLYGNYSKFIPCDLPCAYGSTYEWKVNNGLIIHAQAMSVGPDDKASKQHKIDAFYLSAKNNVIVENLLYGLSLNKTTITECKQKINLKKSLDYEHYLINGLKASYSYKFNQNGLFTYLSFSSDGMLLQIEQFTFDTDLGN